MSKSPEGIRKLVDSYEEAKRVKNLLLAIDRPGKPTLTEAYREADPEFTGEVAEAVRKLEDTYDYSGSSALPDDKRPSRKFASAYRIITTYGHAKSHRNRIWLTDKAYEDFSFLSRN